MCSVCVVCGTCEVCKYEEYLQVPTDTRKGKDNSDWGVQRSRTSVLHPYGVGGPRGLEFHTPPLGSDRPQRTRSQDRVTGDGTPRKRIQLPLFHRT